MFDFEYIGYVLNNAAAVTAITSDRIFYGEIPENSEFPAINYFDISRPNIAFGAGERPRFQLSCRAVDYKTAKNLELAVRQALWNNSGSVGGFDVQNIHIENSVSIREPNDTWNIAIDFFISYSNA